MRDRDADDVHHDNDHQRQDSPSGEAPSQPASLAMLTPVNRGHALTLGGRLRCRGCLIPLPGVRHGRLPELPAPVRHLVDTSDSSSEIV